MRRAVRRPKELLVVTIMTASLLVLAMNTVSPAISGATATGTTSSVMAACNNTFNGTKFPLEYKITGTPSASPVPASGSFTVEWNVTVVASAGFLNGVYNALGAPTEIPITVDKVTIKPLSGATGAPVQAGFEPPADPFVIPEPPSVPVTANVDIPIGSVTGTYTADASGAAKFTIAGNAFAPAGSWGAADTLPAGFTGPAWNGVPAVLTDSGKQTYTTASLFGGIIAPSLICMGGSWTQGGTADAPTFGPPFTPDTTGFGCIPVDSDTGQCPAPVTTTTATTGSTTTTTTGGSTTTTTGGSTTTTTGGSTTTTTGGSTTSTASTTTTTAVQPPVTGTTTYTADCIAAGNHYSLTYEITATAVSKVAVGDKIKLYDQAWKLTVPADLITLLRDQLQLTKLDSKATVSIAATNADPAKWTSPEIASSVDIPASGALTTTIHPADAEFTATGVGDATFTMAGASIAVTIGGTPITMTCTPTAGTVKAARLRTAAVAIPPVIKVTVVAPASTTTTASTATTATSTTLATTSTTSGSATTRLGSTVVTSGATVTAVTTTGGTQVLGTSLARTGPDAAALWVKILTALLLFEFGLLLWAFGESLFNRRVA